MIPSFYQELCAWMQAETPLQTIAGKQILTRTGETETKLYWIQDGAVQAIYETGGAPQVIRLAYRGSIINALPSFLSGTPSGFALQTLRKTQLHAISGSALKERFLNTPERLDAYRALLEQTIVQQNERELDLLQPDPLVRYQRVYNRSPQLFEEIPLRYIASYLRMTPETLSRIRKFMI
ncbi:MAG: Crp/Fnr family transcriptional regulator [Sphingobacteriales bacterium]|nr:MAG: Crp/Fnr family transcriptional regulator [Sphingobacteriales bacterium]